MASINTISNLYSIFSDFSNRSYIVNTFGWGANYDIGAKEVTYPLLWVDPVGSIMIKSTANDRYTTIDYTFTVKFLDLVKKGMENVVDVESDMLQLGTDLVNEFNDHPFYQRSDMQLVDNVNFTKLESFSDDQTYGYEADVTIRVMNVNSFCGIPVRDINGFSFDGPEFSAVTYSPQFLQCDTVTACTSLQNYITLEIQSQSQTTWSGGSVVLDSTFLGSLTVNGDTIVQGLTGVSGSFTTLSAGTIYSGSTDLYDIFSTSDNDDITRVQPGSNVSTGGTGNFPIINVVDSPIFNNIDFSGTTTGGAFSGSSFSADTIYSGGTNIETIITNIAQEQGDKTRVQPGTNISTGGTDNFPTVNLDADIVLTSVNATSISATTLYSGSTDVSTLFEDWTLQNDFDAHTGNTSNPHNVTATQLGVYTTSESDALLNTKANLSGATFTGAIDAPTILSAGTDLYSIFITSNDGNDITRVQPGTYITTGGTANEPTVNLESDIYLTSLSADTLYSGSTNLYDIFATGTGDVTRVQPGSNINTGGTDNFPIVSLVDSPSLNNLTFSGTATGGSIIGSSISATTFYSGSTNLSTIIANASAGDITRVQNGLNTYTGGTANLPTINISAATLDHLSVSGDSVLAQTSATTIAVLNSSSATTTFEDYNGNAIESGTSLSNIVGGQNNRILENLNNIQIIGGNGITGSTDGTTYTNHLDVQGDMLSGGTNLYDIFSSGGSDITRVQPGTYITTGGTDNYPTVNLAADINLTSLSASTLYSGSTNLYSIFAVPSDIPTVPSQYPYDFMAAVSDETTAITTGAAKVTFFSPRSFTLTGVTATLTTTGSTTTTVDLNVNGSTALLAPIDLVSGDYYEQELVSTSGITAFDKFTVDIDAAGTAATGLKIILNGYYSL